MDAVLAILRFIPPVVFGVGTVVTILALRSAPLGREDEDGFHYLESSHTPEAPRAEEAGHGVTAHGVGLA